MWEGERFYKNGRFRKKIETNKNLLQTKIYFSWKTHSNCPRLPDETNLRSPFQIDPLIPTETGPEKWDKRTVVFVG